MKSEIKISIFGSGGLLGSELMKKQQFKFIGYHRDVDIKRYQVVYRQIKKDRPDWIVNTAAFNDVDGAEKYKKETFALNANGPAILARVAKLFNIPLIHLSTDYVFSSRKQKKYKENDSPHPQNTYGESKLAGELKVRGWEQHYILRTSALFGMGRSNHATKALAAFREKKEIPLAVDLICSPTFCGDLADWILSFIIKKPAYGIYHAVSNGHCSRLKFAEYLCLKSGLKPPFPFKPVHINKLGLPAYRPPIVMLDVSKISKVVGKIPTWKIGIDHFIEEWK